MTAEEKLKEPTYGIAAIEDWRAHRISRDRLFEIFRVNLFVGYGYINDDDKTKTSNEIRDILSEAIRETVMVEHRPNS